MSWRPILALGWILFAIMFGLHLDRQQQPVYLAGALLVTEPAEASPRFVDNYAFRGVQFRNYIPSVRVVVYKTQAELRRAYEVIGKMPAGAADKDEILAFAHPRPDNAVCEIHIIDPEVDYEPAILGHEFAHCLYGLWHGVFIK